MLKKIVERNPNVEKVLVDNCCTERQLYLDLFPQCGGYFSCCAKVYLGAAEKQAAVIRKLSAEYGLVFRCIPDQGQERAMATPSKEIILSNLNLFLRQNI